jgi:dienelactone hydrolase
VTVKSGKLTLRGLLWHPRGSGRFPAVLFNHGAYTAAEPITPEEPQALGPVFAKHGYVFLFLFRRGVGLSASAGPADGDVLAQAMASKGVEGRNRAQLLLMHTEDLNEANSGLQFLRKLRTVDSHRVAVAGHSFGGSLTLFLAARDRTLRAVVIFSGAAFSWSLSPRLRLGLLDAVAKTRAPVLFLHAANDYSTASGQTLDAEMERLKKPHLLRIYPPAGQTEHEGHNFLFRAPPVWETDVFTFLGHYLG